MLEIKTIESELDSETALLILVCRAFTSGGGDEVQSYIDGRPINWQKFYELVAYHAIRPVVYSIVSKCQHVDQEVIRLLRRNCLDVAATNMLLLRESISIAALFESNGINYSTYKGVLLGYRLFGNLELRECRDIDFLVTPKDVPKADRIMLENGFRCDFPFTTENVDWLIANECQKLYYKELPAGQKLHVELQWRFAHRRMNIPFDHNRLLTGTQKLTIAGKHLQVLDPTMELFTLICHHGVIDGWRSAKHLLDLAWLLKVRKREVDWVLLNNMFESARVKKFWDAGISAVHELIMPVDKLEGIVPPANHTRSTLLDMLPLNKLQPSNISFNHLKVHLSNRQNARDRLMFLWSSALFLIRPNWKDISIFKVRKHLFFTYYLLKPFRLFINLVRGRSMK